MTPSQPRRDARPEASAADVELLQFLSGVKEVYAEQLRSNVERRLAVERGVTQLVETAVKINSSLVTAKTGLPPIDYHRSSTDAGSQGIISAELADRLAPSAGLRNRLVHEYDSIDYAIVAEAVGEAVDDYGTYIREVAEYLRMPDTPAGRSDAR